MRFGAATLAFYLLLAASPRLALADDATRPAPTDADLAQARTLYGEAVADENSGLYETALGKFKRVQAVKDTANVRYRIATCLEGLGQRVRALGMYEAAIDAGATDKTATDAVKASREKVEQLKKVIAHLTVAVPASAPADLEVWLDHDKLTPAQLNAEIAVDTGSHALSATGTGMSPYHTEIALPEGGRAAVTITVTAPPTATPPRQAATAAPQPASESLPGPGSVAAVPPSSTHTLGWISVAGGGVLVVASGVVYVLRHGDIATINDACRGGPCPPSRKDELTAAHDRATFEGPLAIGLGAVGILVTGIGAYWLARPDRPPPAASLHVTPLLSPREAGLGVRGSF